MTAVPMQYDDAIAFIHGAYGLGEKRALQNMHALLALLGDPHRRFKAVHVAGTNGKGSVCAFVQAGLRCAGYRTGLYTSPFLQRYNERIRVDGVPIADNALAAATERVAGAVETLRAEGIRPTEFEIGTAIAFSHFAREKLDIAVVEVGLGGRMDPTNVIEPLVTLIAAIDLDHTRVLGDTPEAIAGEKAGIVKPHVPMFLSAQNTAAVQAVVAARCGALDAPFAVAPPCDGALLGLPGGHQAYNAGVAVAALQSLRTKGYDRLTDAVIGEGLRRARWPGRLEWLEGAPRFLLDGAHNAHGARALADYVRTLPRRKTVLVCGVLRDKDWQGIVDALAPLADVAVTTEPDSRRALSPRLLADAFMRHGVSTVPTAAPAQGIEAACTCAGPEGRVIVAGSLYLVGEARTRLLGGEDTLLAPA